jgi:hypothetical protein
MQRTKKPSNNRWNQELYFVNTRLYDDEESSKQNQMTEADSFL